MNGDLQIAEDMPKKKKTVVVSLQPSASGKTWGDQTEGRSNWVTESVIALTVTISVSRYRKHVNFGCRCVAFYILAVNWFLPLLYIQ